MGEDERHLKVEGFSKVSLLMFNYAEEFKKMGEPSLIDAIGYPSLNVYRGNVSVQFQISANHIRPAS